VILADVLPENSEYVLGAYLVFFALLVIYIVIMAVRLSRLERDLVEMKKQQGRDE
jgi:hypothetical protein